MNSFPEERLLQTLISEEKKNPLKSLVLISFELRSVTSYVFPVLWIPAFQTLFLVISCVFPFLCFTTTHSPHFCVFSYSRVFDSCVPNMPLSRFPTIPGWNVTNSNSNDSEENRTVKSVHCHPTLNVASTGIYPHFLPFRFPGG